VSLNELIQNAETALSRPHETGEEKCLCTDSVHSGGSCPDSADRGFYSCPRREGLFRIDTLDSDD
jgi:hypothetical protein